MHCSGRSLRIMTSAILISNVKEIENAMKTHDEERQAMKFGSQKRFFEKIW